MIGLFGLNLDLCWLFHFVLRIPLRKGYVGVIAHNLLHESNCSVWLVDKLPNLLMLDGMETKGPSCYRCM
jgi:hypothetical protein